MYIDTLKDHKKFTSDLVGYRAEWTILCAYFFALSNLPVPNSISNNFINASISLSLIFYLFDLLISFNKSYNFVIVLFDMILYSF